MTVRLDVWLDVACLFKTRSEAQRECKVGRITVNGAVAKPHRELRVGDELVISRPGGRKLILVVRGLADKHMAKPAARELYQDRTPPPTPQESEIRRMEKLFHATGRPERPDRRTRRTVAKRKWTT